MLFVFIINVLSAGFLSLMSLAPPIMQAGFQWQLRGVSVWLLVAAYAILRKDRL